MDNEVARRRKLYALAQRFGMSREERLELSEYLLRRDITSWKQLDDAQVSRLLDAFEGYALITYQFSQRSQALTGA